MKVKSISPAGVARTYDLTVAKHHNFVVNGQVVHNCLKDVSRVLEVPYNEVNAVTNSILERSSGDERASATIEDSFKEFEVCRAFDKKYPKVLHHAKRLEGMAKNLGIHAAGVIASPVPLTDVIPLEIRKHNNQNVVVSAGDMYAVGGAGLVKLDVLGLRTLTVLKEACEAVEERHGRHIDLESAEVNLNDPKVLAGFTAHDYGGVFQYDTPSADKVCSGVTFDSFEDIAAMTALNRPGTSRSGLASKYVERKKNPKLVKKVDYHPAVSEITKDTLGIIVYQEHVIKIFIDIAGFAPGTADSLRKTIAKKVGDETMGKERANFVAGAVKKTGMSEETAHKIMNAITFFGSYGFNKCIDFNTLVYRAGANAGQGFEIKIGDLHKAQQSKTSWGQKIRAGKLNILQMDPDGRVRPGRLKAIHANGKRQTLIIETPTREIRVTDDHRLLTSVGYVRAIDFEPGRHELVCMGEPGKYALKGRPTVLEPVISVRRGPVAETFDVEMATPEHNFIANGIVSHNSHATAYGMIAFWCVHGQTKLYDWGRGEYVTIAKAYREGVDVVACYDEKTGRTIPGKVKSIIRSGRKPVWKVKTRSGRKILCSAEHLILTSGGYKKACELQEGDLIAEEKLEAPIIAAGRTIVFTPIKSASPTGETALMYDVSMESEPHNFLANNVVVHNCMWLKTYYPLEFYWALLKNEPDRIRIQQYAKSAKKRDIEFLPPSVSKSKAQFSIDGDCGAVRGSLVDIKGVGTKAAEAIMATQPYTDFWDLLDRIDRRKVHKGVMTSLALAGALDDLLPNSRWFVENVEDFWKLLARKGVESQEEARRQFAASADAPAWEPEERQLVASRVSPLAFGKHPMDTYGKFIESNVLMKIVPMSNEDFFTKYDGRIVMVGGVIVELKMNQIGDFHTGREPDVETKRRMFWGSRYANLNIEDVGGKQNRIKFDFDVYPRMRPIIELGLGAPVLVVASVNGKYENLRASFAVDLEGLRKKLRDGDKLGIWERIVTGDHPVKRIKAKSEEIKKARWANRKYRRSVSGGRFWGVVTNVRLKYDRRGQEMAFFGLIGGNGYMIDVVCFGSQWGLVKSVISPGALLSIDIDKRRDDRHGGVSHFFNGGVVKRYKTQSTKERP